MMQKIWIAVLVFFSTLTGVSAEQAVLPEHELLRVGHILFPPFYFSQSVGMDADMIRTVAANAQIKTVKFIQFKDLTTLMAALNEGSIDLIANGIIKTPDREEQYLLTTPYDNKDTGIGILYTIKMVFADPTDLKKFKIGTLKGSHVPHWFEKKNIKPVKLELYDTWDQLMDAFSQNKIDGIVSNYTVCHYAQQKHPKNLNVKLLESYPLVYMLQKQDRVLQEKLNVAINTLSQNSSLQNIKAKYIK